MTSPEPNNNSSTSHQGLKHEQLIASQHTDSLFKRVSQNYRQGFLVLAIAAVGLNYAGMIETLPFRWIYAGVSMFIFLFLIGYATSKAKDALALAQELEQANQIQRTYPPAKLKKIRQSSRLALRQSSKALNDVENLANSVEKISQTNELTKQLNSKLDKVDVVEQVAYQSLEQSNEISERLVVLERAISKSGQQVNTDNYRLFQIFNRHLTDEHIETLKKQWFPLLGIQMDRRALGYLAHRVCLIEDTCSGRLASTVEDMLLRILVARSVAGQRLSVLEIGSLFGINLGIIYETCRGYFKTVHLTAIDPLDGYYGESRFDKVTQVPISRDTFDHNMRQLDLPFSDVTVAQGLSTDPKILETVKQNRYNLLFIDGDHSYEGVKFDFENYLECVEEGGYIMFDDYGTNWPDVAKFVDSEVLNHPQVQFIGASKRSAVFRVSSAS
ncbi:class I SAM-dependent methyltransferase [Vacuolonema iberomarrocanum]|uniref:class I SAM-dependent methyltransferase n=1 Tax=Vacuolonema iberomarrocanum TaxID=3454632 RepID=UPI0019FDCEA3|nr:class I SAM-dependent methyltransferase [filamentous cyanobacterium LEGE 07170]